jgi:CRP-like cAMP-binding protein
VAPPERAGTGKGLDPSRNASPGRSVESLREPHLANRLLAALEPADFELLRSELRLVELRQGETLYEPGEPVASTYFPHGSLISLVAVLEDGATAEVAVFGREGVAGFVTSLVAESSFGRYVVQMPGTASRMGSARLLEIVKAHPSMQDVFTRYSQALLFQTFQTVACNALHSVEARCCCWILTTRDRAGRDDLPLTHDFLAEMLGVQRPTVSIIARHLQVAGLIQQGRGKIQIVDGAKLEQSSCACYRTNRRNFERLLPGIFAP